MATAMENDIQAYKTYRNVHNRLKRETMMTYHRAKCNEYKTNSQKLWQLINTKVSKTKHSGSVISHIMVDSIKIFYTKQIADQFSKFYSNLGSDLASNIRPGNRSIANYISAIPQTINSMVVHQTSQQEVESIICKLLNKMSSGYDKVMSCSNS